MKKKSICFVVYDLSVIGGVEQVTASLANALCKDYDVHILNLCNQANDTYWFNSAIKIVDLSIVVTRLRIMHKYARKSVCEYLDSQHIDIAFLQGTYAGYLVHGWNKKLRTKVIFCDHGALVNEWRKPKITIMRALSAYTAYKTVCLTKRNSEDYHRRLKIPNRKLRVIPNWIDTDACGSREYNVNSKKILAVGRFGREKGFDLLVKIFSLVTKQYPDWSLDIYGDGEMMPIVQNLVDEYQLNNNVHLMGFKTDINKYYGDYAMYVMTSYREGFPLVLLEAKLNRLPIVSFDIATGPREIISQNLDGILIPPYDLEAFSEAICDLITHTDKRLALSKNTQKEINKFSKNRIYPLWINLIETVCSNT